MNLHYINIWLSPKTGFDNDYRYEFTLRTRFISNYFSKQIRKYKFATDGTFNMISVDPMPEELEECKIVPETALTVAVKFDKDMYEQIKGSSDYEYYLNLLAAGFIKASEFKEIPLDILLSIIDNFRKGDYKNQWLHKKKRFKEQDIEIILNCCFTTLGFKLIAIINKISTKEKLCSGILIRTEPDEIYFGKMFRDILIDEKNIMITDAGNSPRILISLRDAFDRKFAFELLGDSELKKLLSY